jgi:hypothetical protein
MRLALLSLLNGLSVAALYFIVASGFTLTFGLMRTSNWRTALCSWSAATWDGRSGNALACGRWPCWRAALVLR